MPKPYSYDLRQKVIQSIELGEVNKSQASVVFQISRNTIDLWFKSKAITGDYQAKPNLPQGNGHKITDWEKFTEFIKVNGEKTQVEMAKLWGADISSRTISRGLEKIGFTRKKRMQSRCRRRRIEDGLLSVRCTKQKLTDIKKEMKKNDKNLLKN
jgi:transposase